MFDIGLLHTVERECGFRYPPELRAAVDDLAAVASLPGFAGTFPQLRAATAKDVLAAWELGMAESLVPFMCEVEPAHTDYYCCARGGEERGQTAVAVFAIHAIVADWPSFAAFVEWARHLCSSSNTEPIAAADRGSMSASQVNCGSSGPGS